MKCPGCDGYGEDVSMGEECNECDGSGVVAELTPRQALEALGFRFEPVKHSRGKSIEVVAPPLPSGGGVSWRERATWPDSPDAARYITETLLGEAENRATNSRYFATLAEHAAVEAEATAARLREVAGRVRR